MTLNDSFDPLFLLLLFPVSNLGWLSANILCHSTLNCLQKSSTSQRMDINKWISFSIILTFQL
ncbi:hypothetical protein NEOC84_000249|nr:hypothetical protein [Neochlamydia sp. AcF84]